MLNVKWANLSFLGMRHFRFAPIVFDPVLEIDFDNFITFFGKALI